MRKISLSLSLLLLFPVISFAETYWGGELPNISNTQLKAEVTRVGDIYTYTYIIISGSTNTGQIWSFDIDIKQPREGVVLSGEGLVNGPGYLKYTSAQVLSEPTTPKMVPVGLFSPPNWNSGPDIFGQVGWGADDDQYMILPGQNLNGFQITSRGLPGIRDFRIEPDLIPPSEKSDITNEEIQAVEDKVAFKGKTLGPTAPPLYMDFKAFLETIRGYINESVALGWLIDPTLTNTLKTYLDTTGAYIDANDPSSAKATLQQFMSTIEGASLDQRTKEAYGLLYFNARYLHDRLPDTYIPPPPPLLELKPEKATLPIGEIHTLTATLTQDKNPMPGYPVVVEVTSGPNQGLILNSILTDTNGQAIFSYTSTKEGTDQLVARVEMIPARGPKTVVLAMGEMRTDIPLILAQVEETRSLPVEVTWKGGPDLTIDFFFPPLIEGEGGKSIPIKETTGNHGTTPAGPSTTRYLLSQDEVINPGEDLPIGERDVMELAPGGSSEVRDLTVLLPPDLPQGIYHLGACADGEGVVAELDEGNNCEVSRVSIRVVMESPFNQPPQCSNALASPNLLWPPNHKLVTISIKGVVDPDGDPVTITITGITQDEPTNGPGDGDKSPDGFGIGTPQAIVRAERSGIGNGRVYAISFEAKDGRGGGCDGQVNVGVPHDMGEGKTPIDDGQNYDSTLP